MDVGELRKLIDLATDDDLCEGGRYFHETCQDLTQCNHIDIGNYCHIPDGKLVEWLWNHRMEILSALSEQQHPLLVVPVDPDSAAA